MAVPSPRELELELLLAERDAQIAELTDDLSSLRLHLQATPSADRANRDEPVSLPRPVVSLLVNHLSPSNDHASSSNSSVATALTQRAQLLQEENDELYSLLRRSETGKLKEQVATLSQTVSSLETALQDSHAVIKSLSVELDKTYAAMQAQQRQHRSATPTSMAAASPIAPRALLPSSGKVPPPGSTHNGSANNSKPVPTGPRAQKRPRLSSPNATAVRERGRSRERERERDRERERERDRPPHEDVKERNRERERPSRSQSPSPRKTRRSRSPPRGPRGGSNGVSNDMLPPPPRGPDLWPPPENDSGNGSGGSRRGGRRASPGGEREREPRKRSGGRRKNGGRQRDRGLVERLGL